MEGTLPNSVENFYPPFTIRHVTICRSADLERTITLRYAESLWVPGTLEKANRNDVAGKEVRG
ncbi:MAG: hypothetical protein JO150_05175, partial [Acidobacteriaceae bacterium]|nr:hypothetical protein [Acidobacteriaceae bacterium]